MPRRPTVFISAALFLLLALALSRVLLVGGWPGDQSSLIGLRLMRCLSAAAVGASLSLAGLFLQCLLRNRLASPDLLGLASGSGLFVLIGVHLGILPLAISNLATLLVAMLGAACALAATYFLSRRRGTLDPVLLILTGVAIGVVCSAAMMLVRHLMPPQQTAIADRMLQGAIREDLSSWHVGLALVAVAAATLLMIVNGPKLDIASWSDDEALSLGVHLKKLRIFMFASAGLLTSIAVLLAGPIGFVGLICPHIARAFVGPRHAAVAFPAVIIGAILTISADILVRLISLPTGRLPISVITAIVGGIGFIWVVRKDHVAR